MNTVHYAEFKTAFLKTAQDAGYDPGFLEGVLKQSEDTYNNWVYLIDSAEKRSGNPNFRKQAADEIITAYALAKKGEFNWDEIKGQLGGITQSLGQALGGGENSGMLGGGVAGAGGGLILGYLLHHLTGIPLPMALMLGGLGGGGLGAYFGGGQGGAAAPAASTNTDLSHVEPEETPASTTPGLSHDEPEEGALPKPPEGADPSLLAQHDVPATPTVIPPEPVDPSQARGHDVPAVPGKMPTPPAGGIDSSLTAGHDVPAAPTPTPPLHAPAPMPSAPVPPPIAHPTGQQSGVPPMPPIPNQFKPYSDHLAGMKANVPPGTSSMQKNPLPKAQ